MKLDINRTAPGYVALAIWYMYVDSVAGIPSRHLLNINLFVVCITLRINGAVEE